MTLPDVPVEGAYRLRNGGGTTDPLFYMDDAAFFTTSRRALVTYMERFSLYLQFHDVHTPPTKTSRARMLTIQKCTGVRVSLTMVNTFRFLCANFGTILQINQHAYLGESSMI